VSDDVSQDEPSPEGGFARSAGGAMMRGVALIAVAVVLGIVLLQATDGPDPLTTATDDTSRVEERETPATSVPDDGGDDSPTTTEPPPATVDPSTITVLVANGSGGVAGLAAAVTEVVAGAGYETAPPTNSGAVDASVVYYAPGFQDAAANVAQLFDPTPEVSPLPDPSPVSDLRGANVVVIASGDLAE
jgi:hypothetical protein